MQLKTYVISLFDTDRHNLAKKYFSDYGWPVSYWRGVNARGSWRLSTSNHMFHAGDWQQVSGGHIGCNLSHWNLWEHIRHSDNDIVMILEDDAVFLNPKEEFYSKLSQCLADLPSDWQIFYPGYIACPEPTWKSGSIGTAYHPQGTHAYIIKKQTTEVLLNACGRNNQHVDTMISWYVLPKVKHFISLDLLIDQRTARQEWPTQGGDQLP